MSGMQELYEDGLIGDEEYGYDPYYDDPTGGEEKDQW